MKTVNNFFPDIFFFGVKEDEEQEEELLKFGVKEDEEEEDLNGTYRWSKKYEELKPSLEHNTQDRFCSERGFWFW